VTKPFSKLTTVLDSKKGVCLGVSVLYLCLAQRLDLPLELSFHLVIFFVRHVTQESEINIETTARGINYPSENYLDVNTKLLKKADLKEVIGFIFITSLRATWLTQRTTQKRLRITFTV